jgi:hypothetical protein
VRPHPQRQSAPLGARPRPHPDPSRPARCGCAAARTASGPHRRYPAAHGCAGERAAGARLHQARRRRIGLERRAYRFCPPRLRRCRPLPCRSTASCTRT